VGSKLNKKKFQGQRRIARTTGREAVRQRVGDGVCHFIVEGKYSFQIFRKWGLGLALELLLVFKFPGREHEKTHETALVE
jgi:hypothetical protein